MPTYNPQVYVIDDDEGARESLAFLLRAAGNEVQAFDSAVSFLKALPAIKSGCIITDIRMPEVSGIDLLRRLKELDVRLPVIVITGHGDVTLAVEAMKVGAVDFLEKPYDDEILVGMVQAALGMWHEGANRDAKRAQVAERISSLSERERQVLQGLIAGNPNKVIAFDLGISPRTVEIYRANVMHKMQASSLSELVRIALTAGLAETPAKES
jgi:two-component system, LuxR family, response regulator FixJ